MNDPTDASLSRGLDRYFAPFESTLRLVSDLTRRREHAMEVLILLCARIDALASDAVMEGTPSRQAFECFLCGYGHRKDLFESVSIGDLYWELGYHRWQLQGTITQAGRLHRFSGVDDPVIHLFEDAGLPLTLPDCARLLDSLMRILEHRFHVRPRQRHSKDRYAHPKRLEEEIISAIRTTRLRSIANNLSRALEPLIDSKRVTTLLYRRFRCEAIHGAAVRLDEDQFFSQKDVFWEPLYSEYYGAFELIAFPARFLSTCLKTCVDSYRSHLLKKRKIPPAIHFHAFDDIFSNLQLLDQTLLPEGGKVRLKIGR